MSGLLDGIRVLDMGRYLAGPYCGALLADLGADVVRIEQPAGAEDRGLAPVAADGTGALFLSVNRGKRSMTLAPTSEEGASILARLVAEADVVVANLPHPVMVRLGLDIDSLRRISPEIVLIEVSTFGSIGPLSSQVGFDSLGQTMSGSAWLSGPPGTPIRTAAPWVDMLTATNAAMGALAALMERERTGRGQRVEAALLRSAMVTMGYYLTEAAAGGARRTPAASRGHTNAPADVFATRDGWIFTQAVGDRQFGQLARLIGRADWLEDPGLADDEARVARRDELCEELARWCAERTNDEALAELAASRVPAGPVLDLDQAASHGHAHAAGWWSQVDHPGLDGAVPIMGHPISYGRTEVEVGTAAPGLGEHTDELLEGLGYDTAARADLRERGII